MRAGDGIRLQFPDLASLSGTVLSVAGEKPSNGVVVTVRERVTALERTESFWGKAGRWRFSDLLPGTYDVSAHAPEGSGYMNVELAAGDQRTDVQVILKPRVTIKGRIVDLESGDPIAGVTVAAAPEDAPIVGKSAQENLIGHST